jgi:hypothetical protein
VSGNIIDEAMRPQSAPKADPTPRIISAATHSRIWRCTGSMLDAERGGVPIQRRLTAEALARCPALVAARFTGVIRMSLPRNH